MARIGVNPARGVRIDDRPAKVTIIVLTYIPDLSGYFADRLSILQLCLSSITAHTQQPHDLMVFDNGSCSSVVEYLRTIQDAGRLDYLILSQRNIGKIDAFKIAFNAAPGEIIAYNDDDILFYPGWLAAHLEILDCFPKVGMVSGVPVRDANRHARKSLDRLSYEKIPGLSTSRERHIPDAWEKDWAKSTGRDPDAHLASTRDDLELVLRMENPRTNRQTEAIGGANHFQFVTPKNTILQALPPEWTGKLMGAMVELDEAIDELGYLRLSTPERYARHMGNALSSQILAEAHKLSLLSGSPGEVPPSQLSFRSKASTTRRKHWSLRLPGSRRFYMAVYKRLFDILYT